MKKLKYVLLLVIVLVLFVGVASATEPLQEDQPPIDETVASDTSTVSQDYKETTSKEENKVIDENPIKKADKNITKTINKKTKDNNLKKDGIIEVHNYTELVNAVNNASSAGADTTIRLLKGSYNNTGTIEWNTRWMVLTIDGNGQTINGHEQPLFLFRASTTVVIKNITITNATHDLGGALLVEAWGTDVPLTVTDSTFINNSAEMGGAIYILAGDKEIDNCRFINCKFINNTAAKSGGAIYIENSWEENECSLINCTFVNNIAKRHGGAVCNCFVPNEQEYVPQRYRLRCYNSLFVNNSAGADGGAIYKLFIANNCTFINNSASSNGGATVIAWGYVSNCTFINNSASRNGGAIFGYIPEWNFGISSKGDAYNCTFINNSAGSNGGAQYRGDSYNCTFINNSAGSNGGAIYINYIDDNRAPDFNLVYTIINATIQNNIATNGGAIWNDNHLNILDSKLENNTADNYAGAIVNNHTLNILDSKLENNNAVYGGAINNNDKLIITQSTLTNNAAHLGGAIRDNSSNASTNISYTNFINNRADFGGAINSLGWINITNTTFKGNTAYDDKETIVLDKYNDKIMYDNTYDCTDINLKTINLALLHEQPYFQEEDIILNFTIELEHPYYYDDNILEIINKTIYLNDEAKNNTKFDFFPLYDLQVGEYNAHFTTCNRQSNNVTFTVSNQKFETNVSNYTGLVEAIENATHEEYASYYINLLPGDYNATQNITLENSATKKIFINGNNNILDGQNTYQFIKIAQGHTLTLKNITLTNYNARLGGAILNYGNLTVRYSTFENNSGEYAGAIYNINRTSYANIMNSNFTNNRAISGAAIISVGYFNSIGNRYTNNSADNNETIYLGGGDKGNFEENIYESTDIQLNEILLSVEDNQYKFYYGDNVTLNYSIQLTNPNHYKDFKEGNNGLTFYINNQKNITTKDENITLTDLQIGNYTVYYTTCNQQSNNVTFIVIYSDFEVNVSNYQQLVQTIENAKHNPYNSYKINLLPGDYNATQNITLENSATQIITINGNGNTINGQNKYQFINISSGNNLTLENLTITNYTAEYGGAIYAVNGTNLTVRYCNFTQNTATENGGAIYLFDLIDTNLDRNLFENNKAAEGDSVYSTNDPLNNYLKNSFLINDDYYNVTLINCTRTTKKDTFTYLNFLINIWDCSEVSLTSNFTYDNSTDSSDIEFIEGIPVNNDFHLIGNGYCIDGLNTATIFQCNGGNVTIENITLKNSNGTTGGAISISKYVQSLTLNNCNFTDNHADNNGGAIGVYDLNYYDYLYAGVTFNNCSFTNNTAGGNGGAISHTGVMNHCMFINNTAGGSGGAISHTVSMNHCIFINNTAGGSGGAIDLVDSIDNCTFTNNHAYDTGGAIFLCNRNTVINNCNFTDNHADNHGGVIFVSRPYIDENPIIILINNCNFTDNHAESNGGAICISDNIREHDVTVINCNFTDNHADNHGGAICGCIDFCYLGVNAENCTFINNSAGGNGGACLYPESMVHCIFINNSAGGNGGAMVGPYADNCIFINNTAAYCGGAIYEIINSNCPDGNAENCIFINNSAGDSGGATYGIYAKNSNFTNNHAGGSGGAMDQAGYINHCTFTNNTAEDGSGGAIVFGFLRDIVADTCIFTNNHAGDNGGAILLPNSNSHIELLVINCTFTNNTAIGSGGTICADKVSLTITQSTIENTNATKGGAIFTNIYTFINSSTIQNSNATENGGAIYNEGQVYVVNSTIGNSNTNANGGAICTFEIYEENEKTTLVNISNSIIRNCNAKANGGAIYNLGDINGKGLTLTIEKSLIRNNTAAQDGGAISSNFTDVEITENTFENNHAGNSAGALISCWARFGLDTDIIDNIFRNNTAKDKETLVFGEYVVPIMHGNTYEYTDINLEEIILRVKDDQKSFICGDNITLTYNITPVYPGFYPDLEDGLNDITLYINGTKNRTQRYENTTLTGLKQGTYDAYFTTCNQQSETITFKVNGDSEINVTNYNELVEAIENATNEKYITYKINLLPGDYNATTSITWNNSATPKITINGNGNILDGLNTYQFISIDEEHELILENITIRNYTSESNGIICNYGTLIVNNSVLKNNMGFYGGTILNDGILTISNSTLEKNRAYRGGAIFNNGILTINNSTLKNNTAYWEGGAIFALNNRDYSVTLTNSNFIYNTADKGAAIYHNTRALFNITNNMFKNNTAEDKETLNLGTADNERIMEKNTYENTDILLNEIKLNIKDNQHTFQYDEDIVLNYSIKPANPDHYLDFEDGLNDITLYINNEKNITTKYENTTLTDLQPGAYTVYFTSCNQQSNNVTFTVTADSQIRTPETTYEYYNGANNKIPLIITDISGQKGTIKVAVKDQDEYKKLFIGFNVEDGYNLSSQRLVEELENLYKNLNSSYVINITYSSEFTYPSSTEFTLNINKQRNTTITIDPIQSSVGLIANLSANVVDVNNEQVSDGLVVFKVNGITLKDENNNVIYANVNNGLASINYKVQSSWIKNTSYIEAVYGGTETYASSRIKATDVLNISQGTVNITLEKELITAKTGETITLRVKVVDSNGDRINNGKIIFKLNGITLKDENGKVLTAQVTDGDAVLDYTIPPTFTAKTYTLTAVYSEKNYERTETTSTLTLEKKAVIINTDSITTTDSTTTIKATITDETGKLLVKNTKIAIKINGKTILNNASSTNGKIDVSFNVTFKPGMYELLIISAENGIYKSGKMTTVLKI